MSSIVSLVITSSGLLQLPCALSSAVQLWWVNLDVYSSDAVAHGATEGRESFDGVMAAETRRRAQACHQALRDVLAEHYGCATKPEDFSRNAFGKPHLVGHASLQFSISHAEMHGLIGVNTDGAIGVDIERIHVVTDADALVAQYFTDSEQAEYRAREEARMERFLTCWTRKEACSKALGVGLRLAPGLLDAGCTMEARFVRLAVGTEHGDLVVGSVRTPGDSIAAISLASMELGAMVQRAYDPLSL